MTTLIYCFIGSYVSESNVYAVALSEDGIYLAHLPCHPKDAKAYLGLGGSKSMHYLYEDAYPEGYQLQWISDPATHLGVEKSMAISHNIKHGATVST